MRITIHRGENQIGGNIVEIKTETTKLIIDVGCELDEGNMAKIPDIPELFDFKGYDGVFISHNHLDHIGLAMEVCKDIPIYMGEGAYKVLKAANDYQGKDTIKPYKLFNEKTEAMVIGDITIKPILVDHSAFDSYMFLIEDGCEKVLYTGDFRSNGRKSFENTLSKLPTKVDTLICEGTTLSRPSMKNESEESLEIRIEEEMKKHTGPVFILQSAMNIDRIVTMYKASRNSGRLFLEDFYMAQIAQAAGSNIPNPKDFKNVKVFTAKKLYDKQYDKFNEFGANKISKKEIPNLKFAMCIRCSMEKYLLELSKSMNFDNGILIYSMWKGYKEQIQMQSFLKTCQDLGLEVKYFHTSGHADSTAIKNLIKQTNPTNIRPIHTENSDWFKRL